MPEFIDTVKEKDVTKWLDKLESALESAQPTGEKGEEILKNARAYVSDCHHWLEKGNLVLAFECMIHAWAVLDTARVLGAVEFETEKR